MTTANVANAMMWILNPGAPWLDPLIFLSHDYTPSTN
jgi:hypothetical protein